MDNATEEDTTSDLGESVGTSEFTSVNTREMYSYEAGRRYQGFLQGRYGLPNDDTEQFREALKHKLYIDYLLDGKLYLAPIGEHPQKIVDLGTGVGFWAQDMAENFPSARVIGTDLSPIQPHWTAPNVEFRVEDLEDEFRPWTNIYVNADLIHIRALLQTLRHPRQLIERSFEALKPGGWIEIHEVIPFVYNDSDGEVTEDHPFSHFYRLIEGPFAQRYGWNVRFPLEIVDTLHQVGFVNVQEHHTRVPIGRWPSETREREMGMFNQHLCEDWITALLARNNVMGLETEEANEMGQRLFDAFNNPRIHVRLDWIDCWAQKPWS
ncbi:S-adenosyl-L-methionine-dependent methyltransferase [Mariannaea sp. PMI_226]|nr:S-adenosyl-L-methionine-dependent methyltransferase [Mariannaea sp. PMI_226]